MITATNSEGKTVPVSDPGSDSSSVGTVSVQVCHVGDTGPTVRPDLLAAEEPLEIRLDSGVGARADRAVSVTMRTPGHDRELAVGFLFAEGIITAREQILAVHACKNSNVVRVRLRPGVEVNLARLERHFCATSSCGVCGKSSLDAVRVAAHARPIDGRPVVEPAVIRQLPETLRDAQVVFDRTGGLHAAALFDAAGNLLSLREDVGRHNAVDKLIGAQFLAGRTPLFDDVLLVSGRTSFELVQKAAVAGLPILAAVGAPSSLAVDLAREHGLTLIGFVRPDGFNVYTGADRVRLGEAAPAAGRRPLTVV
jgi:FdhD protein